MPENLLHVEQLLLSSRPHHRARHTVSPQEKVSRPLNTVELRSRPLMSTNKICLMGGLALGAFLP